MTTTTKDHIHSETRTYLLTTEGRMDKVAAECTRLVDRRALSAASKAVGRVRRRYEAPGVAGGAQ